ncbi:MAG TPA: phosphoglycerate mutase family protein [Acidimicrobiales bacterium]|nr:phosphoglycerate mutase family protein [Acidimicrobiales bacterium]
MPVVLLRHASAGERGDFDGEDLLRPLDALGRQQAAAVVAALAQLPVSRILSSPARRCVETAEPLARDRGLTVETTPDLWESCTEEAVGLIRSLAGTDVVACTHGDIVPAVLDHVSRFDGVVFPANPRFPKGSAWVLAGDADGFKEAWFIPPP